MQLDIGEATTVSTLRPSEALVPGLPAPQPDGLNGEVACLRALLARQGADATTPELMGVSGAAFRAYFYRRKWNPDFAAEPDWCWTSEIFSSRDAFRAIADYTQAVIERKDDLEPEAAWALVEQETSQGRALLSYGIGGPFEPVLVTGFRRAARRFVRVQSKFLLARDAEVDITGKTNWAGEAAPIRNPLVIVQRPAGTPPGDAGRRTILRVDACRWAVAHGRAGRERLATGKHYAAGAEAFEAFADLLADGASGLAESLAGDAEAAEATLFVHVMACEWERAREAAGIFLDAWAFELEEFGDRFVRPPGGVAAVRRAAAAYRAVAEALAPFAAAMPTLATRPGDPGAIAEVRDAARRARAAEALRAAGAAEARAVAALEAVVGGA
jgi:hypothetical protein